MEDSIQSFHSSSSRLCGIASLSASSSPSASFDDSIEDSCSICLEPFSTDDPSSITNCKHEYHLHCILEWSQRSLECPICCRLLVLSDPSSQELLAPLEAARHSRTRHITTSMFTNDSPEHDSSDSDDPGIHEETMQHLMVMRRDRYVHGREEQRSGSIASHIPVLNSSADASGIHPVNSPFQLGNNYPVPMAPSGVNIQPFPSGTGLVRSTTTAGMDVPFDQRVLYSQPPAETPSRLNTSEAFAFPESIKSKFTIASTRYKESISKSTRGLREKLLAHNSSVKELSKGVQREMNASLAGLTRMIERLELSSKRTPPSPASSLNGGASSTPFKGKNLQENVNDQPHGRDNMVCVPDLSSAATSHYSSMVPCPMEVRPAHLESGH